MISDAPLSAISWIEGWILRQLQRWLDTVMSRRPHAMTAAPRKRSATQRANCISPTFGGRCCDGSDEARHRHIGSLLLLAVFVVSVIALLRGLYKVGAWIEDVDPY